MVIATHFYPEATVDLTIMAAHQKSRVGTNIIQVKAEIETSKLFLKEEYEEKID